MSGWQETIVALAILGAALYVLRSASRFLAGARSGGCHSRCGGCRSVPPAHIPHSGEQFEV